MNKIEIINFSKGPFEFDDSLFVKAKEDHKDVDFGVKPRLRYSADSDYMGFQFDILLMVDKQQVLKTGFLVGLAVEGWAKMLQSGVNLSEEPNRIIDICKTAWLFATGVVAEQTQTRQHLGYIIPDVDFEKLSKEVLLMPSGVEKG